MTETEYRTKKLRLEQQMEEAEHIKCPRVAAKFGRMIDELEKEFIQSQEYEENAEDAENEE